MKIKTKYNIFIILFIFTLMGYFYFNFLNPERDWVKYHSINDYNCNIDIYYDRKSIKKRFFNSNSYQILIKEKGNCLVDIYDDFGNVVGEKIRSIDENTLFFLDLKKNTYRYSHSPFENNINDSGQGKLYREILKQNINQ